MYLYTLVYGRVHSRFARVLGFRGSLATREPDEEFRKVRRESSGLKGSSAGRLLEYSL